ncbi:RNA polymerase sigma factor SigJ [Limnoglobus roseus]|uniref:RNA polymerase sigma-70 factor n=1 Tax=Limnoglobus roseus TaxID=2598579 RepID=A0A5C1AQA5_9BACT|nr:RNA polymerase sigma factor SigJ [Limnoglobus roseus]QEL20233.1 RNA polymerase sigma-70 factor [Limnoglobus roseus]
MNDSPEADVERFRSKLLAVAYRMLGTAADAEDAVQDAYLRYHQHAAEVQSPEGWLVKTTTRLCLDRLRRAKREEYVGPWLPEPVPETWPGAAAVDRVELAESLSMAFLVLLETLSPVERAAYLLREVFGYEFDEIGDLLDKSPVNVRQITARAKKRLGRKERRFVPRVERADDLATRFFAACQAGDAPAIETLLAEDVTLYSDGGGKTFAAPKPVRGVRKVANLLAVVFRKLQKVGDLTVTLVNGRPGVVFTAGGKAVEVFSFDPVGDTVGSVYVVLNPDKLRRWSAPNGGDVAQSGPWEKKSDGRKTQLREAGRRAD